MPLFADALVHIPAANPQSAIVRSPCPLLLKLFYLLALPGVSTAYQSSEYSIIFLRSPSDHDDFSEDLNFCDADESNRGATALNILTDDVLLEIFDLCRENNSNHSHPNQWHLLVHVCQRWRQIVFGSPHRLNLQIFCTYGTPVRQSLGIWPAFPIVLDLCSSRPLTPNDEDNAIAALEHSDRVRSVRLHLTSSQWERMATMLLNPFPLLTRLKVHSTDGNAPVLPDVFLGGFAPCLQEIYLHGIPFPALPTLLLSTGHLVILTLSMIPPTGYIPPEAMAVCLAALPKLESFTMEIQSTNPQPVLIRTPPATRMVLPALISFHFQGTCRYLEDLVAQIDSPQLRWISVVYLNQPHRFQAAQLSEFINRSAVPQSNPLRRAHVDFELLGRVSFILYRKANDIGSSQHPVETTISFKTSELQLHDLPHVLSQFDSTLRTVAHLELDVPVADGDEDLFEEVSLGWSDVEWPLLFRQFPAMHILVASGFLAVYVAIALESITVEMVPEVFPSLHLILIEGEPHSSADTIVAARRLSGRPVTLVDDEVELKKMIEFYYKTASE